MALVRVLGAVPAERPGDWNGDLAGATPPGFAVASAQRPQRLELRGRHRFASYAPLVFVIEPGRVRAQTFAVSPGIRGRLYRALVIGSGGHGVATRRCCAGSRPPLEWSRRPLCN
jgi:hypothetical protein